MKKIALIFILILSFSSCKSSKLTTNKKAVSTKNIAKKHKSKTSEINSKVLKLPTSRTDNIIGYAQQFKGVRYKWGGTTKTGMDCSGLVYESFKSYDVFLPRISRDMAKKGYKISLKKILKGDLLFFKTGNRRNAINHVGLVVDIKDNNIKFIHATTSKGVIVSGLNETYWLKAFHEARRIL
ncbi:hypothetical protein GCM10023311_07370 [Flaviramulus aquimarinus]|uniref:NlpC/P60 domain-containing protein n=1 Tax=Flaviramulus aquimarinus TaxID=1170456 RepID=A0ABP9ESZ4_9FLAO